ncbi:tetratricopeptide repeat protein [Archangium lansingense]|uniref:Tetratricopeptide repeat protein n=1 Tax=Archangium lansingense TaxID=2995310 RepID=A0ABT4ARD9_9BACT|nr:tetratricopeptide repeat protein [Archangium lansinium]MCY1083719.1 tetratricopeptide repeat protein [Archangium lansinium]
MTERNGREAWPPELTELLRKVDKLRRSGRHTEALSRMRQLTETYPRQVRVLLEMGLTLGIWGSAPAEALPWYERALELAPGHASAQLHRALSLARLGRHAEAVADFNALEAGSFRKALVLHMKRAESLEVLCRHAEAERDWTLALAEEPGNPWLLHQRASVRARLGRLEEAVRDITDSLAASAREGEPVDAELLRDRGVLRARLGDTAGARADFEAGLAALREGDPPGLADDLRNRLQELA